MTIRGNNREPIFRAGEDYRFYLEKLQAAFEKQACPCFLLRKNQDKVTLIST
jgi:hypothetical protein